MSCIKIVTDSTADIPRDLLRQFDITVVPLKVSFGKESFLEGEEITPAEFYEKLQNYSEIPVTSQPSPGEILKKYQELADNGANIIISLHISKKMSGTYQSALIAKKMLEEINEKIEVKVIDSELVCMSLGLLVLAVAKYVKEGRSFFEFDYFIDKLRKNIRTYFLVDTLEYLQKGGRIGKASSYLGNLLNIKPILTLRDGEVHSYEKVRGINRGINVLVKNVKKNQNQKITCAVVHANSIESAFKIKKLLLKKHNSIEVIISDVGAVVGSHAGPGTVALMYYSYE